MIYATFDRLTATPLETGAAARSSRAGPTLSIRFAAMLGAQGNDPVRDRAPQAEQRADARSPSDQTATPDRPEPAREDGGSHPAGRRGAKGKRDADRHDADRQDAAADPGGTATRAPDAAVAAISTQAAPFDVDQAQVTDEGDASASASGDMAEAAAARGPAAARSALVGEPVGAVEIDDAATGAVSEMVKFATELLARAAPPVATETRTASAAAPAAPSPVDAAPDAVGRQLDLAQGAAWLDRLAADIVASAASDTRMRFDLAPAELGRLTVDLANSADGTAVRLVAETREAHRVLSDAQTQLVAEARAQGLRISEAQIELGSRPPGGDGAAGQGGDAQQRRPADPRVPARATVSPPRAVPSGPAASDLYA